MRFSFSALHQTATNGRLYERRRLDDVSGHPLGSMVSSKFQIDFDSETNSVRLRCDDAVMEPYLAFTLSTRWPRGFLQREYTVLLDLPAIHNPVQHEIVVSVPRTKTPNAIAPKKRKMTEKTLKTVQNDTQASPDNARTVKQPDRSATVTTGVRD
jgi:Tfp pilus assembly protein FimV